MMESLAFDTKILSDWSATALASLDSECVILESFGSSPNFSSRVAIALGVKKAEK